MAMCEETGEWSDSEPECFSMSRLCNIHVFAITAILMVVQTKICDVFLIFSQNVNCNYSLEPPYVTHTHSVSANKRQL